MPGLKTVFSLRIGKSVNVGSFSLIHGRRETPIPPLPQRRGTGKEEGGHLKEKDVGRESKEFES